MTRHSSHEAAVLARRQARAVVLQVLYEIDSTSHSPEETLNMHLAGAFADTDETEEAAAPPPADQSSINFVRELVLGIRAHGPELDQVIQGFALEFPVDQMAIVDRNLLRMALYEMLHRQQVPLKVAINEAVELAKLYGSESAPRFVNGVLGALIERRPDLLHTNAGSLTETAAGADEE